jgi:hypothetical protein
MKSRYSSVGVVAVLALLFISGMAVSAQAEVNLNINVGSPPLVVSEPAAVVLAPSVGVYFVPNAGPDLFFYAGYWWSPKGGHWYRSSFCIGPWSRVERRHVPSQVVRMPGDYRVRYAKGKHVPYGQWKKAHYRAAHDNGRHGDHGDKSHKKNKKGHGHDD